MNNKILVGAVFCLSSVFSSNSFGADFSFQFRNPTNEVLLMSVACAYEYPSLQLKSVPVVLNPGESKAIELQGCIISDFGVLKYPNVPGTDAPTGVAYPKDGQKYVMSDGITISGRKVYYMDEDQGQTPNCWIQGQPQFPREKDGSCRKP